MQVEILPALTRAQRRTLYGWGRDIFGADTRLREFPCRPFECFALGTLEGQPVAAVGLVKVQVTYDAEPWVWALGFGGLVVVPRHRGKGYGAALINQARDAAGDGGLIGFCEDHRLTYYQRRGFHTVTCPVFIMRADGRHVETPQHTVWMRTELPAMGALDVRGLRW